MGYLNICLVEAQAKATRTLLREVAMKNARFDNEATLFLRDNVKVANVLVFTR